MSTNIQDAKVDFLTPYKTSCLDRYLDIYLNLSICRPTPLTSTPTCEYVGLTTLNQSCIMPTMRVSALQTYHRPPWLSYQTSQCDEIKTDSLFTSRKRTEGNRPLHIRWIWAAIPRLLWSRVGAEDDKTLRSSETAATEMRLELCPFRKYLSR